MIEMPRNNARGEPWSGNRRLKALYTLFGAVTVAAMLIVTSCSQSGKVTTSASPTTTSAGVTTSKPATGGTSVAPTTAKPSTTAVPTTSAPATFGDLKIATATFGKEKFEVPILVQTDMLLTHPIFDVMIWTEKGEFAPAVVERWTMASDALSWTLNVRKGVKFHNGDEVTAKDIKFSLEQYQRKDSPQPMMRTSVDLIQVVDNYTVRVTTKGPQPYFPSWLTLGSPQQGAVMPKD
ncbi:MAG: hypothetical protein HYY32_02210, partial [Chloroflexi bacterium]|nr:hypothetical protein [Chloroflexota bacterium]